jgi:hypothetical protein
MQIARSCRCRRRLDTLDETTGDHAEHQHRLGPFGTGYDQARIALHRHDYEAAEEHITAAARLASRTGSSYTTAKLADLDAALHAADGGSPRARELADLIASTMAQT